MVWRSHVGAKGGWTAHDEPIENFPYHIGAEGSWMAHDEPMKNCPSHVGAGRAMTTHVEVELRPYPLFSNNESFEVFVGYD